jgi:hypothetical protein
MKKLSSYIRLIDIITNQEEANMVLRGVRLNKLWIYDTTGRQVGYVEARARIGNDPNLIVPGASLRGFRVKKTKTKYKCPKSRGSIRGRAG